jgi:cysteine-rich repeat protein
VHPGETCDDGNANDNDGCTNMCTGAVCGDSIVQMGIEDCDDGNMIDTDDCIACKAAFCGDGLVHMDDEECDDANEFDTDACTTACENAACGDSFQQAGEECDDGNLIPTDFCTGTCTDAFCGDGITQMGVEGCDDGNMIDDDACSNACVAAACGDNVLQPGEECDEGDVLPGDGCSAMCLWEFRYVFVTSTVHAGDFGGLAGADAICNLRAQAAGLQGTYMAWISPVEGSPLTRFVQSTVPYRLTSNNNIATNWATLTDGGLTTDPNKTETNGTPPVASVNCSNAATNRMTWTGTNFDGTPTADNCSDFTTTIGIGAVGRNTANNSTWSVCGDPVDCTNTAPLYCFQQ